MSSSFDISQNKLKQKRNSNYCSTPVETEPKRLSSISISAVDTNSSSSAKTVSKDVISRIAGTKRKTWRKKQTRKTKRKSKKDSDSDWETESEQTVYDETLLHDTGKRPISDSDNNVFFMDLTSPEHVRDAPRFIDDRLESPIFRPNQWQIESPRKIAFEEKKDTLPLKELPSLTLTLDDPDEEEEPLILRRDDVKTYPGRMRENKKHVSIDNSKKWLIDVKLPTTSSDILWDQFLEKNCNKIKYHAPSSNYKRKRGETEKVVSPLNTVTNEEEKNWIGDFPLRLRKNVEVVRGYCGKSKGKWVHTYEEYKFPGQEDEEFRRNSRGAPRMTLNQYLQKCRNQRNDIRRDSNEPGNESSLHSFEFRSKRPKVIATDVLDSELQNETATTSRSSTLKRVRNDDKVFKRRRITAENKPTIRTVELLSTVRYNKEKNKWENI